MNEMHEINPKIKKLINKNYPCANCQERHYCEFGDGPNPPYDCNEDCLAAEAAEGMQIVYDHLCSIQWNEAIKEIIEVGIVDKLKFMPNHGTTNPQQ